MKPATSTHRPSTSSNRLSTPPLPDLPPRPRTLRLTSYGHKNGPLIPRPHLSFDVRNLPNPPKHVRNTQSGLYKPLQDWLVGIGEVRTRLGSITEAIQGRMGEVEEGDTFQKVTDEKRETERERERELWEKENESRMEVDSEQDPEESRDTDRDSTDSQEEQDPTADLSIAIFCHLGKHRSVALVEILSKHRWNTRGEWDVVVEHRDLVVERTQAVKDRRRKRERDRKNSVRGGYESG